NPGNLVSYTNSSGAIIATFTNSDPGHFWEGPSTPATGLLPTDPNDLLDSGRVIAGNQRLLISDLDATVLQDAYGYTVTIPSRTHTFLIVNNSTTHQLTITGDPQSLNDTISVTSEWVPGSAIPGVSVTIDGQSAAYPPGAITSLRINSGDGNDNISVD